jgi:hypothetical protein
MAAKRPIRPEEIEANRVFPDEVIQAFNEAIAEGYVDGESKVVQEAVIDRIKVLMPGVVRSDIFKRGWLNIEGVYRAAGWTVEYDKPGYNEAYKASFTFRRK